jgi:enoyl-CoA hydratase/carnithine racemase
VILDGPDVRVILLTSSHRRVFSSRGNINTFADTRPTITKGGLHRSPDLFRATGRLVANELMMTGQPLSAIKAAEASLVNRVVSDDGFVHAQHA